MLNNKKAVWILGAIFTGLLIASLGARVYLSNKGDSLPERKQELADLGFYLFDKPRKLNDIPLANLQGEEKSFTQHLSGWRIVNTGYMSCPDICPINLALLNTLKNQWEKQTDIVPFNVLHLTFDPKRDTPELLKEYLHFMNPDFYGLTGDVNNIQRVMQQLNMVFIYEEADEHGNYFITHSDSIALINPDGEYIGLFKGPYSQANMIKALRLLLKA